MEKLTKSYFGKEILICGVSQKDRVYYNRLYKAFTGAGIHVYGLPTNPESELDFKTVPDLDSLDHIPECAFMLCPKTEEASLAKELRKRGVKKLLVYSKSYAPDSLVSECAEDHVEVRAGCPLLLYGGGTCALHALFAGESKERKKK